MHFNDLKPVLEYFPVNVGNASVIYSHFHNAYKLNYKNPQWCTFNKNYSTEIKEQFLEINLAKGKIVTTGLGFGLIQTILANKEDVEEVIVFEREKDIIDMFKLFVEKNNFDDRKIKIINNDAINASEIKCDWLLLDHFECIHQTFWEIIDQVREISNKSKAANVLFWPMVHIMKTYCDKKQIPYNNHSYQRFKVDVKIDKLPDSLDELCFPFFDEIFKIPNNINK